MWNRVEGLTSAFGVFGAMERLIAERYERDPTSLPDLTTDERLIAASDYSGAHAESRYDVITCILTTSRSWARWEHQRQSIRHMYRLHNRRISYTKLNDIRKLRALAPFLHAANWVEGVLCSVAISKELPSVFDAGTSWISDPKLDDWRMFKPAVFEQMLRVATLLALLVAGFSRRGQSLLWITDQDEIAANIEQQTKLTTALANMIASHTSGAIREVQCMTTGSDSGGREAEDLASIADLAGGALTDFFSSLARSGVRPMRDLHLPAPQDLSGKALQVLYWFRERPHPLRRLILTVEKGLGPGDVTITPIGLL